MQNTDTEYGSGPKVVGPYSVSVFRIRILGLGGSVFRIRIRIPYSYSYFGAGSVFRIRIPYPYFGAGSVFRTLYPYSEEYEALPKTRPGVPKSRPQAHLQVAQLVRAALCVPRSHVKSITIITCRRLLFTRKGF
jgi:hypothetical protein